MQVLSARSMDLTTRQPQFFTVLWSRWRHQATSNLEWKQELYVKIHERSLYCDRTTMGTTLASHQSTCSIHILITFVQSSQYQYPTLLGNFGYTKPVLQSNMDITKSNILNEPDHGEGHHGMEAFSIVGPTMWNELLINEQR